MTNPTVQIRRAELRPWAGNPRKKFGKDKLRELAESLRSTGQLQNLVVRELPQAPGEPRSHDDATHEVILGERRWRAAELAGLEEMACVVREITDKEAAMMAVMENTHRDDLDVEEEASGYKRMQDEGWEIKEIAEMTGKKVEFLYSMLDLLKLDKATLRELGDKTISRETARALGRIEQPERRKHALERVVNEGGAPLSQKVALEVIKQDYLSRQAKQAKWEKRQKELRAAYPGAEIVTVEESYKYFGFGSAWVRLQDKPEEHELAVHMRGRDAVVPTWGELARKHGAKTVVAPDDAGDPVGMVEKGPLEAAERTLGESNAEACVFAIAGGQGRHEQSQARQRQNEQALKEHRDRAERVRGMQTGLLRYLKGALLGDGGNILQVEAGMQKAVGWLFEQGECDGMNEVLALLGIDVKAIDPEGGDEGAKIWAEGEALECDLFAVAFLMLSLGIGAVDAREEGAGERLRQLAAAVGFVQAVVEED